ncbi:MAG: DUF4325 domain-containing protein [Burkholderiales bacterium]|nr:MAG: DUF4325 domain-containing protein [Burkholderiales bacterium]
MGVASSLYSAVYRARTCLSVISMLLRLFEQELRTTFTGATSVFDQFAEPEEFTFAKTIVPVKLAQHEGEKLVSRSQAKRLTMRFERFQTVVLDFSEVAEIGQAFADEVFRVFQIAHPQTLLMPLHMTPAVSAMVARARAHNKDRGSSAA